MAMRRPRIKPVANILLNSKRKTKSATNDKSIKVVESDINNEQDANKISNSAPSQEGKCADSVENTVIVTGDSTADTTANKDNTIRNENLVLGEHVLELEKNKINTQNISRNHLSVSIENDLINTEVQDSENANEGVIEMLNDSEGFKCPPKIGFQRTVSNISNSGIDDVFYSDIEENALQMDYESSPFSSCPMSPSKNLARQRIRPTPHFGQRRNSFVGSSPSPHTNTNEDNHSSNNSANTDLVQNSQTRRERHHSASFSANSNISTSLNHNHVPHKHLPAALPTMGRTRTESGCSVLSDTSTSTQKLRKKEDHKHRKDFESRCYQKVPDKNALKMGNLTYTNTGQNTPDKNALRMCDLIYYNPATNPMEQKRNPSEKVQVAEESFPKDSKPFVEKIEKETDGDAVPVPQLKLNAKGELILDDTSLVIETTAEQEARKVLANSSLIYLDECTGMNGFYTRRKGTRKWLPSETIKFYRCLQNVGTDFSLMVALFPNRTRRDLKLKFKKEERKNSHLINKAIVYPKLFDIESLKQELDEEQRQQGQKQPEIDKKKAKKKKTLNTRSKAIRVLINGNDVYQNEPDFSSNTDKKSDIKRDRPDVIIKKGKEDTETQNDQAEAEKAPPNKTKHKSKNRGKKKNASTKSIENKNIQNNESINDDNVVLDINEIDCIDQDSRRRTPTKAPKEGIIKEEIIKIENKQESNPIPASNEYHDTKQLQTEIDELLGSDALDVQYDNTSYQTSTDVTFNDTSQTEQYKEQINTVLHKAPEDEYIEAETDIDKYEHTSFINLDDGSVNVYSNIKDDIVFVTSPEIASPAHPSRSQSPNSSSDSVAASIENVTENYSLKAATPELNINNDTCSSVTSEHELSEADIQSILRELATGSLVLVSTLDPDDPDKVLNEIYMVDKNTGNLCDEPLGIPDSIVQCILTVVS